MKIKQDNTSKAFNTELVLINSADADSLAPGSEPCRMPLPPAPTC